jgi:hypothetical protein
LCQRKEHSKIKNIKPVLMLAMIVLKHANIVLHATCKNRM